MLWAVLSFKGCLVAFYHCLTKQFEKRCCWKWDSLKSSRMHKVPKIVLYLNPLALTI